MTTALQIARSGLDALDQRMRTISNNLANVNTTGFKRDRAAFVSLAYQDARQAGTRSRAPTPNMPPALAPAPACAWRAPNASTRRAR